MKIVDYLAEEIKREEAMKMRKAEKHVRMAKLVESLKLKAAAACVPVDLRVHAGLSNLRYGIMCCCASLPDRVRASLVCTWFL